MAERDEKGRFVKGHKGAHKAGRKLTPPEFKKACEELVLPALGVLKEIMMDPAQPASSRLKAAEIILDRTFGKPFQSLQIDETDRTIRIVEANPESAAWNG